MPVGRKPNDGKPHRGPSKVAPEYRARCRAIVEKHWERAEKWASEDPDFYRWCAEQGYGRAPQALSITEFHGSLNMHLLGRLQDLPPEILLAFVERGEWHELPPAGNA